MSTGRQPTRVAFEAQGDAAAAPCLSILASPRGRPQPSRHLITTNRAISGTFKLHLTFLLPRIWDSTGAMVWHSPNAMSDDDLSSLGIDMNEPSTWDIAVDNLLDD